MSIPSLTSAPCHDVKPYLAFQQGFGPYPKANPHYLRITADATKAFLSLTNAAKVLYLDVSNPDDVKIKAVS